MNNNGCQIYFILLPNLLVWIEIINIQKLVTNVTHCLSGVKYLYVCYTAAPGSFKAPGQSEARPVSPTTGIWLRKYFIWEASTGFIGYPTYSCLWFSLILVVGSVCICKNWYLWNFFHAKGMIYQTRRIQFQY